MSRLIECSACHKKLKVPENLLGKQIQCPACGVTFVVIDEKSESPAPAAPTPPTLRQIQCPKCSKQLKIPDKLLGKRIKCPGCGEAFTAGESAAAPMPPRPILAEHAQGIQERYDAPQPEPVKPRKSDPYADEDEPSSRGGYGVEPRRDDLDDDATRRRRRDPYDDDDDGPRRSRREEYDDDFAVPHRGRRRDRVDGGMDFNMFVLPTGIVLGIVGLLGIGINVFQLVIAIVNPNMLEENNIFIGQGQQAPPPALSAILGGVFSLVALITVIGSITMMLRKSYSLSMVACIMAMINIGNCCCVLGLPVGLWAIIMLCRPEVKDAFD